MKKITFILAILAFSLCAYAQKPVINQIGLGGRAIEGKLDFNSVEMMTKVADGQFVWYGKLLHQQTSSGSQGFKAVVNRTTPGNWLGDIWSLRATAADVEVSDGNTYNALYLQGSASDFKWRLKQGEDGYYKVTFFTSDVNNVTMRLDRVLGTFADLVSLSVDYEGAILTPAFDPSVTTYSCVLMKGTTSVKPTVSTYLHNPASGTGTVDVSSGTGVSTIKVTSLDGSTTKDYTINYSVSTEGDDINYTGLIVNSDFDYVTATVAYGDTDNYPTYSDGSSSYNSGAWRPVKTGVTTIATHLEYYGWQLSDWEFLFKDDLGNFINVDETTPNQSIGINAGGSSTNGSAAWINGNSKCFMPNDFEFYQVINKDLLDAGTYKLTCLLAAQTGRHTSQRLFANNSVQFFGKEEDYELNKTPGEIYSYGGYTPSGSGDSHYPVKVYVTISDNDSLKIGIRSGTMRGNGDNTAAGSGDNMHGWFKMDDFRLIKLDPAKAADATISSLTLDVGTLTPAFNPATTSYTAQLPQGTTSVTPTAVPNQPDAAVAGAGVVDVSSGTGVSTIITTALDGTTTKTYTINYTVDPVSNIDEVKAKVTYIVNNRSLTVQGTSAYAVYTINGMRVADVKVNNSQTSVTLDQGVYIVKTNDAKTFKVLVK
ncbi:MAG: Cadherin-like beta sandwich domain protein [Bacteroidetes bacterium ADurb.Bin174]|nr:MAG: Cadherin-like beta sandwich domain protein [Bacteroidetes bacterium ADurb.Bin174]